MFMGVPGDCPGHNHRMPVETTTAGAAVLEIERFEWTAPDRIEIVGYWTGLRGRRFMRPTLVLKGEGEPKRLLALLEHKPWAAHEGEAWTAAFAWDGEIVKFQSAELNVGSGIDLELPSPRMRPGKPRRFRQRVVARDASREPKLSRAEALKRAKDAALHPTAPPAGDKATVQLEPDAPPAAEPDTSAAAKPDAARTAEPDTSAAAKPDAAPAANADAPAANADASPAPDLAASLRAELESARATAERIRTEREDFRRERDQALEKVRSLRGELEAERQSRERAVADARAEERSSANQMLGEGAELRAGVERQREIAYLERDDAKTARDEAIAARAKACEERDAALAEAKDAKRDRKEAFAQRDRAVKLRDRADAERASAILERDRAVAERAAAVRERDEVLRLHERGMPVHPPKPRFLPEEHEQRSEFDIWAPRASALAVLLFCAFIVLRLFGCG
jgi:hypothetical protein